MVCADNCNYDPTVGKAAVQGLEVGQDAPGSRIGQFATVVAKNKHARLFEAFLNDAAVRSSVQIDPRLAPRIIMAELQGGCAAEGMAEHADSLHIESTPKLAGLVCVI